MLKRFPVKYIRDYLKKRYQKTDHCYICGKLNTLEFHHLYSVSELFNSWCVKNKISEIEWDINQDHSFKDEINIGTKVFHMKFGHGKIIEIDNEKAIVDFENISSKKIYLKFLKIID